MRLVQNASFSPGHCLVSGESEGPLLDLEANTPVSGERIYLRPGVVQQAAKACNLFDKYERKLEEKDIQIAQLKAELAEADKVADAASLLERTFAKRPKAERFVD